MQNGKYYRQFTKGMYRHRNYFLKMLAGVLIFAITMSLYYVSAAASKESGLCEHHPEHTDECGYIEGDTDSVCKFVCEVCDKEGGDLKQNGDSGQSKDSGKADDSEQSEDSEQAKEQEKTEDTEKSKESEHAGDPKLTVVSWSWDSDGLVWNDSAGQWGLGLPGRMRRIR